MSWPPRCHSSVQANTNAPAHPPANARSHLPIERVRLRDRAVAPAVEADLGDEQRPIAGEVLQAREIGVELITRLEVDVEADEVEERQPQVLGRGVVDVRDEPSGSSAFTAR